MYTISITKSKKKLGPGFKKRYYKYSHANDIITNI